MVSAIFRLYQSLWEEPSQANLILISEFHCFSAELFNYKNEEMEDDFLLSTYFWINRWLDIFLTNMHHIIFGLSVDDSVLYISLSVLSQ